MLKKDPVSASCVLLVFLLLTPVSPTCRKGTADECKKAELVPGYNFAGKSFDIYELMLKPLYQEVIKDGECTLCENPLLKGKPLQRLPLIISDWKANISCQKEVKYTMHHSAISVADALAELLVENDWGKVDLKVSPSDKVEWATAGSRSEIIQDCIRRSSQDKYIFLLHHISCSYYRFHVSRKVSDHFNESVNLLPENYNPSSKKEYFRIIRTYGTHFVKEFNLGAYVRSLTFIPVCEVALDSTRIIDIQHCLAINVGVAFGLDGLKNSTEFRICEERKKTQNTFIRLSGSSMKIEGGFPSISPKEWLESTKSWPGLVSYSLEPLHYLVDGNNPRNEGLQQALSEYMRENILWRNCTKPCPPGSHPRASDFCSCECPTNNFTNSMCCALKRGLAKLTVTIEHAEKLWGDIITRSDGYVTVSFESRRMCTQTLWNNNDPTWNATLDFGIVQLDKDFTPLQIEVWDQDSGWNDDLLGTCRLALERGTYQTGTCRLNHGQMYFMYHLVCGHNLVGTSCWDYSDLWPYTESNHDYYHY